MFTAFLLKDLTSKIEIWNSVIVPLMIMKVMNAIGKIRNQEAAPTGANQQANNQATNSSTLQAAREQVKEPLTVSECEYSKYDRPQAEEEQLLATKLPHISSKSLLLAHSWMPVIT